MTFKKKRSQPITLIFVTVSFLVSALFVVSTMTGHRSVWCKDNAQERAMADGASWCVASSTLLIFGALSMCCWWFCQALELWLILANTTIKRHDPREKLPYYHAFSWSLPATVCIICLATGKVGYSGPTTWCFLRSSPAFQWGVFYTPVALLAAGGAFFISQSIYYLYRKVSSGDSRGAKRWKHYKMPVIFAFCFVFVWFWIFATRIYLTVYEEDFTTATRSWVACLLKEGALGAAQPTSTCGAVPKVRMNFFMQYMIMLCVLGQSIFAFAIYGTMRENHLLWFQKLGIFQGSSSATTGGTDVASSAGGSEDTTNSSTRTGVEQSSGRGVALTSPPQPPRQKRGVLAAKPSMRGKQVLSADSGAALNRSMRFAPRPATPAGVPALAGVLVSGTAAPPPPPPPPPQAHAASPAQLTRQTSAPHVDVVIE